MGFLQGIHEIAGFSEIIILKNALCSFQINVIDIYA